MEYYGEEIGTVIVDPGSTSFRCGFAGDSSPTIFVPSAIGLNAKTNQVYSGEKLDFILNNKSAVSDLEICYPIHCGIVKDWQAIESLYNYSLFDTLKIAPKEHPLIVTEPADNPRDVREKTTEMVFESLGFDSFFLAKQPVLCCFTVGRYSGLVLDLGGSESRCVPVHDGYVLSCEMKKSAVAGDFLDDLLKYQLAAFGHTLVYDPVVRGNPTVLSFVERRILRDIKENFCFVKCEENDISKICSKDYKLPDGNLIEIRKEVRTMPAEALFGEDMDKIKKLVPDFNYTGIPKMVVDTLNSCDVDLRKNLIGNIIVSGKAILLKGFYKRLFSGINDILPPALNKLKIIMPNDYVKRNFEVSWLGGSILGSLGTFKQLLISRAEYEESGTIIVHEKCP